MKHYVFVTESLPFLCLWVQRQSCNLAVAHWCSVRISVHISLMYTDLNFWHISRNRIAGSNTLSDFSFLKNSVLIFIVVVLTFLSIVSLERPHLHNILASIAFLFLKHHFARARWNLSAGLICISLMDTELDTLLCT